MECLINVSNEKPDAITCGVVSSNRDQTLCAVSGHNREIAVWSLAINQATHRISVHQAPESLACSHDQALLAYGSLSGSFKLVDLQHSKLVSTLTGHKASVRVLVQDGCSHQRWATGSLDASVCLWDTRAKEAVATMNHHSKSVNAVQFSPHGLWVVSAADDATIKVVDVRSPHQLLASIAGHCGAVSDVRFHPNEYLLTSASADKTVRFWDAETYECVSQSDPFPSRPHRVCFHPSGHCVLALSAADGRLCRYEPYELCTSLPVPKAFDEAEVPVALCCVPDQAEDDADMLCLYAMGTRGRAMLCRIHVMQYQPFVPPPLPEENTTSVLPDSTSQHNVSSVVKHPLPPSTNSNSSMSSSMTRSRMRRSFNEKLPMTTAAEPPTAPDLPDDHQQVAVSVTPSTPSAASSQDQSPAEEVPLPLPLLADPSEVFASRPRVCRSPTRFSVPSVSACDVPDSPEQTFIVHKVAEPAGPSLAGAGGSSKSLVQAPNNKRQSPKTNKRPALAKTKSEGGSGGSGASTTPSTPTNSAGSSSRSPAPADVTEPNKPNKRSVAAVHPTRPSPTALATTKRAEMKVSPIPRSNNNNNNNSLNVELKQPRATSDEFFGGYNNNHNGHALMQLPGAVMTNNSMMNPADFLQTTQLSGVGGSPMACHSGATGGSGSSSTIAVSEHECVQRVFGKEAHTMALVLKQRASALDMVRKVWRAHGLQRALQTAVQHNHPAVLNELLTMLNPRLNLWSLDICSLVIPQLAGLLDSPHDAYAQTSMTSLRVITSAFGPVIRKAVQSAASPSIGVDVSREERDAKCHRCLEDLYFMRSTLQERLKAPPVNGQARQRLQLIRQANMLIASVVDLPG